MTGFQHFVSKTCLRALYFIAHMHGLLPSLLLNRFEHYAGVVYSRSAMLDGGIKSKATVDVHNALLCMCV